MCLTLATFASLQARAKLLSVLFEARLAAQSGSVVPTEEPMQGSQQTALGYEGGRPMKQL